MIGIPLGLLSANAIEWAFHKYVLHGLGRRKGSFWDFHFHEHHVAARRNGHRDEAYARPLWGWNAQSKEALALVSGCALALPLFPIAPFFSGTLWYSAYNYYKRHKRAHLDPDWARLYLPWHFDHHMGPGNANWCVTRPWFDWIMGTRHELSSHTRYMRQKASQQHQRKRRDRHRTIEVAVSVR